MKFKIPSETLQKVVSIISKAMPKTSTLPVIEGVLVVVENDVKEEELPWEMDKDYGVATFTATNLVVSATVTVPVKMDEPGKAVVEGEKLISIVSSFSGDVTFQSVDRKVRLTSPKKRATLATTPDEYPSVPTIQGKFMDISSEEFIEAVGTVAVCAVKDEQRILAGINFAQAYEDGRMSIVAADGTVMGQCLLSPDISDTVIVPTFTVFAKSLDEIIKTMKGCGDFEIGYAQNKLFVRGYIPAGEIQLKVDLAVLGMSEEAEYPDVRKIVRGYLGETEKGCRFRVDNSNLQNALSPVKLYERNYVVLAPTVDEDDNKHSLMVEIEDSQSDYTAEVDIVLENPENLKDMMLNPDYFMQSLKVFGDDVEISINHTDDGYKFIVLKSHLQEESMHLIMGMA